MPPSDDNRAEHPPLKQARPAATAENRPDAGAPVPTTAMERSAPHHQLEETHAEGRAQKSRPHTQPKAISKRAADTARRHGVPCDGSGGSSVVEPGLPKNRPGARPGARPTLTPKQAINVRQKRGAPRNQPANTEGEHQIPAGQAAPNAQGVQQNALATAAREDAVGGEEDGEPLTEGIRNGGYARRMQIYAISSDSMRSVNSYPLDQQPIIKRMAKRAKPWIISCGTFDWRNGDPGEKVPTSDVIVARCFARACQELEKK